MRIQQAVGGDLQGKRVAVLGLSFKADTDDLREAASLAVIPALQLAGATIAAYDPVAIPAAGPLLSRVEWCDDAYETAKGADAVIGIRGLAGGRRLEVPAGTEELLPGTGQDGDAQRRIIAETGKDLAHDAAGRGVDGIGLGSVDGDFEHRSPPFGPDWIWHG